jgi:hypothetical protein
MVRVSQSFYDWIGGQVVYRYVDYYGDWWLACTRWGFRCKIEDEEKE